MGTVAEWAAWGALTVAWQFSNTVNSRSKNSASAGYNAASTLVSSLLYVLSIAGVGNELLRADRAGQPWLMAAAVFFYAVASAAGSVAGQRWALRFEKAKGVQR